MAPGSDAREINNWLVSGLMVVDVSMVYVTQTSCRVRSAGQSDLLRVVNDITTGT